MNQENVVTKWSFSKWIVIRETLFHWFVQAEMLSGNKRSISLPANVPLQLNTAVVQFVREGNWNSGCIIMFSIWLLKWSTFSKLEHNSTCHITEQGVCEQTVKDLQFFYTQTHRHTDTHTRSHAHTHKQKQVIPQFATKFLILKMQGKKWFFELLFMERENCSTNQKQESHPITEISCRCATLF